MYDRALIKVADASQALIYTFHDVESIWQKKFVAPAIENEYYCINRPRNLEWWPTGHADRIFPGTPYNYSEYKQMWWDFLCKDNSDRTYVSLLKFGFVRIALQFDIPDWLFNWWKKFGINRSTVDPYIIESEYE